MRPYDVREVVARIFDGSEFDEFKAMYGYGLIIFLQMPQNFRSFRVLWENSLIYPSKVILYSVDLQNYMVKKSAFWATMVFYSQKVRSREHILLNFVVKETFLLFSSKISQVRWLTVNFAYHSFAGFMVGKEAEAGGIAKNGAKLVTAVSCAKVPKITLLIGGSYGAGNYGMCGRAYSPRLFLLF